MSREAKKQVLNVVRLVLRASFNAGVLRLHMNSRDLLTQILINTKEKTLAERISAEKAIGNGSSSSALGEMLWENTFQMLYADKWGLICRKTSFITRKTLLEAAGFLFNTLHPVETQKEMRKRLIMFKSSDVGWSSETSQLPRASTRLETTSVDSTAASLKHSLLSAYPAHRVCQ